MAHLEPAHPSSPEAKAILEKIQKVRGEPFSEIWLAMLHHPHLTRAVSDLGQLFRFEGTLPGSIREAAILFIAGRTKCLYEWTAHKGPAKKEEVPQEILDFLKEGRPYFEFPEPYADALEAAQLSFEKRSLPSSLQDRLIAQYGKKGVVELMLLTGFYQMLASFLNGFDIASGTNPLGK